MAGRFSLRGDNNEPPARQSALTPTPDASTPATVTPPSAPEIAPESATPAVTKARRSENRQRTKLVAHRWTPEEYAKLVANAEAAGLDVGAFVRVRTIGTKGPRTRGQRMTADLAEVARVRAEIGRFGNNVNQLTRLANMGDIDRPAELDRALALVNDLMEAMRGLLQGEE